MMGITSGMIDRWCSQDAVEMAADASARSQFRAIVSFSCVRVRACACVCVVCVCEESTATKEIMWARNQRNAIPVRERKKDRVRRPRSCTHAHASCSSVLSSHMNTETETEAGAERVAR